MSDQLPTDAEINQIQGHYRAFQSLAHFYTVVSNDKREKNKVFKNFLKQQEDASGEAGLRADGKFYGEKRPKVDGGTEAFQTIGYGHKIPLGQESSFASGITGQQREELLTKDIKTARATAKGRYGKGFDNLKERDQLALTEYAFIGHGKSGKTELAKKIRGGTSSDTDIATEFAKTDDTKTRNTGREKLYSDLANLDMNNRSAVVKKMLDAHISFMEKHAVESLKTRHNIPVSYGEQIVDQQIELAKKFDKKDVSIKDLEKFNLLIARQLGSLGLRD